MAPPSEADSDASDDENEANDAEEEHVTSDDERDERHGDVEMPDAAPGTRHCTLCPADSPLAFEHRTAGHDLVCTIPGCSGIGHTTDKHHVLCKCGLRGHMKANSGKCLNEKISVLKAVGWITRNLPAQLTPTQAIREARFDKT